MMSFVLGCFYFKLVAIIYSIQEAISVTVQQTKLKADFFFVCSVKAWHINISVVNSI